MVNAPCRISAAPARARPALRTPGGQPSHGYSEFVFEVKNRGDRTRTVLLTLPANLYSGPRQGGLRAINRRVTVGPGESAQVALWQPNIPNVPGSGLEVTIDGRRQDGGLSVEPVRGRTSYGQSHSYGRRRSYRISRSSSSSIAGPLMLVSKSVSGQAFTDDALTHLGSGRGQVQLVLVTEELLEPNRMRQRVVIALALCADPELVIADEPTTALDVTVQKSILELLLELKAAENLSMLFISHDLGVIAEVADRVAVMNQSRVVEQGPVEQIFHSAREPYTQGLLSAVPRLGSMAGKDKPEEFHLAGSLR